MSAIKIKVNLIVDEFFLIHFVGMIKMWVILSELIIKFSKV